MKRILMIIVTLAAFVAAESSADAQLLKNILKKVTTTSTVSETTSEATTNGQAAGAALRYLYAQYKAEGKLEFTNINTLMNLATLSTNIKDLKGQTNKSEFYKDFASGLIMGSENLVTEENTASVMEGLTTLVEDVDLSGLTETVTNASTTASTTVDNANEVVGAVTDILNMFK